MPSTSPSQPKESFYLIPIGETGTGKTTLINSFANYSQYATLDEAIENGPVVLADICFTYSTAGVRGKSVYLRGSTSGVNKEIVDVSGVTQTQGSSVYSIDSNDSEELVFYDNPGFGSQSLLQGERIKKPIHAICIVLKPDEPRLHAELRTFLETEGEPLVKNIVYCFTNTRAHSFKPGATLTTLREFLLDLEGKIGVESPAEKENIFCFENDCFRYLCYLAANPRDQSRHHKIYAKEWTTNVEEYKRLISHVKTLTPIPYKEVKPGIAMEPTDFRDLLPVPRRAVVDLLIKQKEWAVLKEFISAEPQKVQQVFEVFMKQSGEHASIRSPELLSEETDNETYDKKEEDTKDDSKLTTSDIADLHDAVRQGNEELAQSLIDKGVDVNGKEGENNYSPLHSAAQNGHVDMVSFLLRHGAIIDSEDNDLSTPLHLAALHGHHLVVEILITAGALVSSKDEAEWIPLHNAAIRNHIESVRTLLKFRALIDAKTASGSTPLHLAARNGHVDMVELLHHENADVNACDRNGRTPLHIACSEDMINVVKMLLQYKATIEVTDKCGRSPLHIACSKGKGNVEIVTLLLQAGANLNSMSKDKITPLWYARANGHNEVAAFLVKYGAR